LKNQQYPEEIVEHGVQKALEKGPIHTELREQVQLDLKLRYIWVSVSFEKMSVIMLLFVDIRIKTSKNGISILLLFMVKRIWSFKELSSV
jgi:hypothetical protein